MPFGCLFLSLSLSIAFPPKYVEIDEILADYWVDVHCIVYSVHENVAIKRRLFSEHFVFEVFRVGSFGRNIMTGHCLSHINIRFFFCRVFFKCLDSNMHGTAVHCTIRCVVFHFPISRWTCAQKLKRQREKSQPASNHFGVLIGHCLSKINIVFKRLVCGRISCNFFVWQWSFHWHFFSLWLSLCYRTDRPPAPSFQTHFECLILFIFKVSFHGKYGIQLGEWLDWTFSVHWQW